MRRSLWAVAAGLVPTVLLAAPHLTFTKSFPGSVPAYVEITVERNGAAEYKEDPNDESPLKFQLNQTDADAMFVLADHLDFLDAVYFTATTMATVGYGDVNLLGAPDWLKLYDVGLMADIAFHHVHGVVEDVIDW